MTSIPRAYCFVGGPCCDMQLGSVRQRWSCGGAGGGNVYSDDVVSGGVDGGG